MGAGHVRIIVRASAGPSQLSCLPRPTQSFRCPPYGSQSNLRANFAAECLGIQHPVEVGGVAESAARQQGIPWDYAAALPSKLDIKSLRIGARRVEHQQ